MARALTARLLLLRQDVPARGALQHAVDEFKLRLTLDDGYAPFETSGYLPCTLDGEDAGFDLRFKDLPADPGGGGRDAAMAFRWGGDPREAAAALIVCAALARAFGAVVLEGEGDAPVSVEQLLAKAKAALE